VPELPDITVYLDALNRRIQNETLSGVRLSSPFLLRTINPSVSDVTGHRVSRLRRVGKRIAIGFDNGLWLVLHLMIAGRLHWKKTGVRLAGRRDLAAFDFSSGTLVLTEAGSKRRASLHVVQDPASLDPGGIEVLDTDLESFAARLTLRNHTLKRALTDPHLFSGIGNAYSDEILHRARLSPISLTQKLEPAEIRRLYEATRDTLTAWIGKLREVYGDDFPEKVTAFRSDMAVHGRFSKPCPVCGEKIARIRYAKNETNYCPNCQTGGRLLTDRSLSRLLKADWPRTPDELERRFTESRSAREGHHATGRT